MFAITVKAFRWENHGTYLIVVARGELNNESAREILRRVDEATLNHRRCKILIDLHEITAFLNSADLDEVSVQAAPSFEENKIVFVCPYDRWQSSSLISFRMSFIRRGYRTAVFSDAKLATDWLAELS